MAEYGIFRAPWRIGFEIEVVLGDLGEDRFAEYGPMDEATPAYRQAVAALLRDVTGKPWSAPHKRPRKTGYYVLSEYDIDPIEFESNLLVAGVELVTPPLPLAEADELRIHIQGAILAMDGEDNAEPSPMTRMLGWHINVDPGEARGGGELDPVRYAAFVDEVPMLMSSGRIGSSYTGLQRHAYGPALLRELQTYPHLINAGINLENFLARLSGASKTYAANFARGAYTELRHYGVVDFMSSRSLEDLIGPVLHGFEGKGASVDEGLAYQLSVFRTLADWLEEHRQRFSIDMAGESRLTNTIPGHIQYDGVNVGSIAWDGAAEFRISIFSIRDHNLSDAMECIALLCLDAAEASMLGGSVPVQNEAFQGAVLQLRDRLEILGDRPKPDPVGSWERERA